jgi:glutathione S-transferase
MQIRHIALVSDWEAAVAAGEYRVSSLGTTIDDEGFIHASTPEQVEGTARRFYADVEGPLVVLCLDTERLEAGGVPVRFDEVAPGVEFPHLYAALPVGLVDDVRPAAFDADGVLRY